MSEFIPIAKPYIGKEEATAVRQQIESGWISMGERVKEFESSVADYIGVPHVVAFNNGTATLHAALVALGVGPGDEVIVPVLSYISSANAVLYCGATPVFAEEDPDTYNVDAQEVERKITDRTKVIIPVDLKGLPVDFDAFNFLAEKYGVSILADSAEAFGAIYKGSRVGSQALIHSFSMFANKNITAGEGGFVSTHDAELNEKLRVLRNQGQSERYNHVEIGFNYRMTDISAAFAIEQFRRIEWIMERKNRIANHYAKLFEKNELVQSPQVPEYASRHSWYMYCVKMDPAVDRDKMVKLMYECGVDHRLSFPPIPLQPAYRKRFGFKVGDFPRAEAIFARFVDIPAWVGMSDDQINYVAQVVSDCAQEAVS